MSWFEALILGIVQGLTEYLPVSSSGHLAIGSALFGIEGLNVLSPEPPPLINMKPSTMQATATAISIKFSFPKAKSLLAIFLNSLLFVH